MFNSIKIFSQTVQPFWLIIFSDVMLFHKFPFNNIHKNAEAYFHFCALNNLFFLTLHYLKSEDFVLLFFEHLQTAK